MRISQWDWLVIAVGLLAALVMGAWASRRAGRSGESYFVADRSIPGWISGISIVATTFAADTPLVVSAMSSGKGIAANWFWWSMGVAHVGMALFWARLWRRAAVVTDAELVELRYGGAAGRALRSGKAVFFAVLYNAIVLGWVMRGMGKIAGPFARWDEWLPEGVYAALSLLWGSRPSFGGLDEALTLTVLVALTALYSTLGGLRGVVWNDLVQFTLAQVGAFALAFYVLDAAGGLCGLPGRIEAEVGEARAAELLAFFPGPSGLPYLGVSAFVVYLGLRWWAHPMGDGGGYVAQRLLATRDPEDAQRAAWVFVALHYVVRSWPWILVGLASVLLFPPGDESRLYADAGAAVAADREMAYPLLAGLLMPPGMLGLMLVSLLSAFMSTVDTHLNWGASYVAHDLWKGRLRPACSPREEALVGRAASIAFAILAVAVAARIDSIEQAWKLVAALGSGMGLPVLLRWIWWRVNAWAEIAGALASLAVTVALALLAPQLDFEPTLAASVGAGAVASLLAVRFAAPPPMEQLVAFWRRVRPPGVWGPVREAALRDATPAELAETPEITRVSRLAAAWALAAVALFAATFAPGYLLLGRWGSGAASFAVAAAAAWLSRSLICKRSPTPGPASSSGSSPAGPAASLSR